jgi:hypothetical protein
LRCLGAAKSTEVDGVSPGGVVLHDKKLLDTQLFELSRFLIGQLAITLRRHIEPMRAALHLIACDQPVTKIERYE